MIRLPPRSTRTDTLFPTRRSSDLREAIAFQMGLKGYGSDVIAKAQEIGAAATRVFASGMTDGIEELDAVRARYRDEPWYKDVYGNYTHLILGMTAEEIRTKGQVYRFGTPEIGRASWRERGYQ